MEAKAPAAAPATHTKTSQRGGHTRVKTRNAQNAVGVWWTKSQKVRFFKFFFLTLFRNKTELLQNCYFLFLFLWYFLSPEWHALTHFRTKTSHRQLLENCTVCTNYLNNQAIFPAITKMVMMLCFVNCHKFSKMEHRFNPLWSLTPENIFFYELHLFFFVAWNPTKI